MTLALEFIGALLLEMLVAPNPIVETLDVIEDFRLGLCPRWVNPLFDPLALQAAEERLRHRVIPTITPATHAGAQPIVFTPAIELITTELTSLV